MAKNFSSVLDSLRAAGEDKVQEVDSVYTLNCNWLLEQFNHTQASLLELTITGPSTVHDVPEQQSTAKTNSRRGQLQEQFVLPTAAKKSGAQGSSQQTDTADIHVQPPVAATPRPGARITRSRRAQAGTAAESAQGSAGDTCSQQFPSPPKTRARGKRNQTGTKPTAVPAATRSGSKAVLAQSGAAVDSDATEQQVLERPQDAADTVAASPLPVDSPPSHVQRVQKAGGSPVAVLATQPSLHSSFDSQQQQQLLQDAASSPVEACAHASPPEATAHLQPDLLQHNGSSTSRHGKRKQSAAGESEFATLSKRRHFSGDVLQHQGNLDVSRLPAELQDTGGQVSDARLSCKSTAHDIQLQQQQVANDVIVVDSPEAEQRKEVLSAPETGAEVPEETACPTTSSNEADANVAAAVSAPTQQDTRMSDYQDAHEGLSSPLPASPQACDNSASQLPAEFAPSPLVHEHEEQQMPGGSPADSSSVQEQDPETAGHDSPAAASAQASPNGNDYSIAPIDFSLVDEEIAAQRMQNDIVPKDVAQDVLGAAAAVPLPAAATMHELSEAGDKAASSSDALPGSSGMAGNLVSAIRSFLPGSKAPEPQLAGGKKPVKVKALEAADAARRKEAAKNAVRIKQKGTLDKQRAERVKAKQEEEQQKTQEEAKRRQEAMRKREEEAAQRRHAKEEAERRERQDRQVKGDAARAKKKAEELKKKEPERPGPRQAEPQASRAPLQPQSSNVPAAGGPSAAAGISSKPVPYPSGTGLTIMPLAQVLAGSQASQSSQVPASSMQAAHAAVQPAAAPCSQAQIAAASPVTQARQITRSADPEAETYQISPYRGDDSDAESSEGDDPRKPIPEWARGRALMQQLASQVQTDPDEVFQQHRKTCSLDEVFGYGEADKNNRQKKDLSRRSSSGNWIEDRVTWKEELNYKKAMGFV